MGDREKNDFLIAKNSNQKNTGGNSSNKLNILLFYEWVKIQWKCENCDFNN